MESLTKGDRGVFVRVSDSDPEMLRYLASCGISPGDRFEVRDHQPFGGPLFVRFGKREHAIGGRLAGAMRVELAGEDAGAGERKGAAG
jgi:DtxR family Mn-dependent transcriptional regulator